MIKKENIKVVLRDIIRHIIKIEGVQKDSNYQKIIGSTELIYDNVKDELTIIHRGIIGDSIKTINKNIESLGFGNIDSLKEVFDYEEKGNPDYLYKLILKM